MRVRTATFVAAMASTFVGVAQADTFTGLGDGTSWEDPLNWAAGIVPLNNAGGPVAIGGNDVDFDADTWAALTLANNLQSPTQYRVPRFLLNENTGALGNGGITFDHGNGNVVLSTNTSSAVFGSRGFTTTVNMLSGEVNTGANTTFGARTGTGILNLSGGIFNVGRANLVLGNGTDGTGIVNITGGTLLTRGGADINEISTFHVAGSGAAQVGIGSNGSVDGFWNQEAGGVLRTGIDGGGITAILIDDYLDDGAGAQGNATFADGSILDPYDLGGTALNTWYTVMTWEGTLTDNGLDLSASSILAGWEKRVDGNNLQVQLTPEPGSIVLAGLGGLALLTRKRRQA